MMRPEEPDHESLEAPERLIQALRSVRKEHVFVPASLDEQVKAAAREHLGQRRRTVAQFRLPRWAGLAAMLCLVALVLAVLIWPARRSFAREDINRDGKVDILDAFAMARQLQQGRPEAVQFDINHDGVIDQRDVAEIARQAVLLAKGGSL